MYIYGLNIVNAANPSPVFPVQPFRLGGNYFPSHNEFYLAEGLTGINQTLRDFMQRLVKKYKTDPIIRTLALDLVADLPQKDFKGEIIRIFDFVKNRIRYVKDIHEVETVQNPVATLRLGQGDCDDKDVLLATLLESIGHPTQFEAVGEVTNDLTHVIVNVYLNGSWFALDPTEPVNAGWYPEGIANNFIVTNY